MFKTKRSIQTRKKWLGLGRMVNAEIKAYADDSFSVFPIKEVTLTLLQKFPELRLAFTTYEGIGDKKTIQNFRGRPFSTIAPQNQTSEKLSIEELLLLIGTKTTFFSENDNSSYMDDNDITTININRKAHDKYSHVTEKFVYSLLTKFESFKSNVINYELFSHDILPTSYRPCNLEKIEEALLDEAFNLNQVRIGFEKFKPRFLNAYTGATPTIYGYFYLELTPTILKIFAQQENCNNNQHIPFETEGYIQLVAEAVKPSIENLI